MPQPDISIRDLPVVETVDTLQDFNANNYLLFNRDVAAANIDPEQHYINYGRAEGRRQYADLTNIKAARGSKLSKAKFIKDPVSVTAVGQFDFLTAAVKADFGIPENPPIAGNDYNTEIMRLVQSNRNAKILDVGAGLRYTYHPHVVNAEIWASASTDVVCVGEDLPFASDQFDFVFCFAVLEHTKRPWLAVDELIRVTKTGGQLIVDWPFLQPVHGYPHHFFNATPTGHVSMLQSKCDIVSSEVKLWQHPIFSLTWILNEWRAGLPEDALTEFDQATLGELVGAGSDHLGKAFCSRLSVGAQAIIAAGTTVVARKK